MRKLVGCMALLALLVAAPACVPADDADEVLELDTDAKADGHHALFFERARGDRTRKARVTCETRTGCDVRFDFEVDGLSARLLAKALLYFMVDLAIPVEEIHTPVFRIRIGDEPRATELSIRAWFEGGAPDEIRVEDGKLAGIGARHLAYGESVMIEAEWVNASTLGVDPDSPGEAILYIRVATN
jgi:hypothetical protein